ncbi:reticulon-like protein B5 [Bidens hawaiensis]|uniref:reticulon-like protein B5 n=1 Tax=Bidens hawaiensis TaxID=980011 RepID=UPI004049B118
MLDTAVRDKIMAATETKIEESRDENRPVSRKRHLFGRQKPLHAALGSGKTADILLWRQKQLSGAIFVSATVIWLLFEWIGYHLLPFLCHFLILTLAILFLWSNLSSFVNKSPPKFPDIRLSQELCDCIAIIVKDQINQACLYLREMTTGRDLKRFMSVILALWVASVIGGWFEFLTLVYILFVLMLSAPLLYERNEGLVDAYGEKAGNEIMAALEKLPLPFFKNNKQH